MKYFAAIILIVLCMAIMVSPAPAQAPYGADVLGAHNGYGRGCVMCHAPHSGVYGNGAALGSSKDPQNGMYALWGQDLSPLFGKTYDFSGDGANTYPVTLPAAGTITSAHDANTIILFCLSCHDGVTAVVGMMKGTTVETLPIVGGNAPTLLAKAAPTDGAAYNNDHPVGGYAIVQCGGQYNWDCTGGNTAPINMNGTNSASFIATNKSSFWNTGKTPGLNQSLASFTNTGAVTAVTCTTCHDQHSMTVYGNALGNFPTMFFVKGQYTPTSGGNSVAQFCRNCHGGESNESHGVYGVPTV